MYRAAADSGQESVCGTSVYTSSQGPAIGVSHIPEGQFIRAMMPSTAPRENRLRVLIADDNEMVRNHLRASLDAEGDLRVPAVAQAGRVAIAPCRQLHPAVLVPDHH